MWSSEPRSGDLMPEFGGGGPEVVVDLDAPRPLEAVQGAERSKDIVEPYPCCAQPIEKRQQHYGPSVCWDFCWDAWWGDVLSIPAEEIGGSKFREGEFDVSVITVRKGGEGKHVAK